MPSFFWRTSSPVIFAATPSKTFLFLDFSRITCRLDEAVYLHTPECKKDQRKEWSPGRFTYKMPPKNIASAFFRFENCFWISKELTQRTLLHIPGLFPCMHQPPVPTMKQNLYFSSVFVDPSMRLRCASYNTVLWSGERLIGLYYSTPPVHFSTRFKALFECRPLYFSELWMHWGKQIIITSRIIPHILISACLIRPAHWRLQFFCQLCAALLKVYRNYLF